MLRPLIAAAVLLCAPVSLRAPVAFAQVPSSGGADTGAPDAFAGVSPRAFYDFDGRLAAVEGRLGALPPREARAAARDLRALRAEERFRRARRGGDLWDFDLELLNTRLDRIVARYPGLHA